ncbi:MAG: alpha-2-macroglobulin family protein [Cyclobacteriaceae bacterium]
MCTKPTNYLFCFLLFLTILSCSEDNSVKLLDTNFDKEISVDQNLNFVFNKALVGDTLLNRWDSTEYITFEPKVKGFFKWSSESVLIFSPEAPFPSATSYTLSLTDKLTRNTTLQIKGKSSLQFSTPALEVMGVNTYWSSNSDNRTLIHLDIKFNHKVNQDEVSKKLTVSLGGQAEEVSIIETSDKSIARFFLPNIEVADETFKIQVELAEGINPIGGNIKTKTRTARILSLKSPYNVSVEDIQGEHNGVEGNISIDISQETTDDAKNFLTISPKISFDIEITSTGLKITSDEFDLRKKYSVTVQKGLKGKYGGALKSDFKKEISFGNLRPEISIEDKKAVYLSAEGAKNVRVKIINVENVEVTLTKLYENNILGFTRNKYYDWDSESYSYNFRNMGEQGDVIWNKIYESKDLPKKSGFRVLNLDIEDKIKDFNGIYALQIKSDERYWLRDSKLISISDIGLVAKEGKRDITVFANSIKTAAPKPGVVVKFIGRNNQEIGNSTTDDNGVAIFTKPEEMPSGFKVAMITANTQDDYNYMTLSSSGVNTSQFDVGGKRDNLAGFDVFIYGDRNIYRPGETMYISGIVRDDQWNTPESIPVKMVINTPDGKKLKTIRKTLNKHGSFETSVELPAAAATGNYTVNVFASNNVFLASKRLKVEEFMPDRIKVEVKIDKTEMNIDESAVIDLKAINFFGPPAANRNYEVSISAKRKYFYSKEFRGYNFSHHQPGNIYFEKELYEGKTDKNGEVTNTYMLGEQYKNMGLVQADIYATVFDETGRPVNRKNTITISTQDVYYGISHNRYYTPTNSEIKFPIIAVNKKGEVLSNVKTRLRLIKHEYKTVLSKSGSYFRYKSEEVEKVIEDKEIIINGKDDFYSCIPELSGRYELRLSTPGVRSYVGQTFYAYGWGGTSNSSFRVNSEGEIDIQLDKESYTAGETANVILKSPFSGKILVTLETDEILKHFYVDTDKRATSFPLEITKNFVPNIYLTATLFKPHEESDLPLTIAHGAAPILVENPDNKLPLSIELTDKSRSKTKQKIKVASTPNTAVSIAVVDEGILQLTQYSTPDPYKYFYRKRALGVTSFDIYPFLFPEVNISSGRVGGDDSRAAQLAKRINPLTNKRVKLVSFWSGVIETDDVGNAEYEIDIPQFSGDLRVMATAYKNHAFASADDNMKVADPLVISTALPRFFSPGDTVLVPVVMSNTTGKAANCKTNISVSGPVSIIGSEALSSKVEANSEGTVTYKIVAKKQLGQVNITVDVDALGEVFKNSTDITVRPASPLQKVSGSGSVKAGGNENLQLADNRFIPESIRRNLIISNSPLVQFSKDLNYLVRYPHGCVEQTVSSVFPQLYFQDLTKQVLSFDKDNINKNSNYFITAAISKLQAMQLYHGGLTYWPGAGYESWWGSVYAAHFLYEARKAGYDVDQGMYNKLLDYLITKLKTRETIFYFFNSTSRKIAHKEIPYSLYVLALAGKAQRSTMNYYKSNLKDLSLDGKYLLAAAYKLIGDDKKYREVLPPEFSGEKSKRVFGGSFYSHIRDEALALNILLEVDEDNPQIPSMAKSLAQSMKATRYLSTQERSFGFLALGKIARRNAGSDIKGTIKVGGKAIANYNNKTITLTSDNLGANDVTIETSGKGDLYYFWETEGISKDGSYLEEDSYLKVRKKFYDRNGRLITSNKFQQNDLIVVMLTIECSNNKRVENVAMTDILPAGFEIENPRISEVPGTEWVKNAQRPDYSDIRDDRITFFLTARSNQKKYFYVVRAVSKGTFQMGPVGADAMYNGEYHSYNGGGTIVVE